MPGLRFTCQPGCVKCCNVRGYVYLSEEDVRKAAAFLNMAQPEFEAKYIRRFKHVIRFKKPPNSQCHFLNKDGCSIHPAKPTQCRLFPYWPELVENRKAWKQTGVWCPGIGKGELIQIGTALEIAEEMKRSYPKMY